MPAGEEYDELVMSLVEESLQTPPGERIERLRAICRDPAIREDVCNRIEWEERMGRFLLDPLVERFPLADPLSPGHLLANRFRIVRKVGSGGMGIVFEAIDEKLGRRVALKCAKLGHGHRLPPEARAAREVSHFNVCKVHDLHAAPTELGELDFLSMEFIQGQTLSERICREGPVPEKEAREIGRQICAGLAQAHRQGVVHGDLKCSNIILTRSDGAIRAVITDFGLARVNYSGGDRTTSGGRGGTLDYMAPELLTGHPATVASDLYALGVLFHNMLTGRSPERTDPTPATNPARAQSPNSRASTVTLADAPPGDWTRRIEPLPSRWKKLVRRCLSPRPDDRFTSAGEVGEALEPRSSKLVWAGVPVAVLISALGYWQWSIQPPLATVRLTVLPFAIEGDAVGSAAGMAMDIAERLSNARRNFTVISPREAQANQVDAPAKARGTFRATHVLEASLRRTGGQVVMLASIADLGSGRSIAKLQGTYAAGDTHEMAKAIIAAASGAFQLRNAVPRESVSGPAYAPYVQGLELLRQDANANADRAIAYFEQAIQFDPKSALPYAGIAEAQMARFTRGDGSPWLDASGASIDKAKSINSDAVPVLLISGSFDQQHGRYEQAIRDLTRALQVDPGNSVALRRLAGVYQSTNRSEDAVATYRKGIEADPGDYRHYIELGNFYFFRNQFTQAEEQYRRAVALAPGVASGHMNLGLALIRQYRMPEAEQALLEALKRRKSARLLMNLGGLYYQEERFEEAARYFQESVDFGQPTPTQYRDLGDAYRHLGRSADAAGAYRTGLAMTEKEVIRNPRDAGFRVGLGLLSAFLGEAQRAEFELSQAMAMEPENPAVMREAVIAYETLKQREKTLELLRNAPGPLLEELSHQPDVKELQQDQRFQKLLNK